MQNIKVPVHGEKNVLGYKEKKGPIVCFKSYIAGKELAHKYDNPW